MHPARYFLFIMVLCLILPAVPAGALDGQIARRQLESLPDLDAAYIARLPRYDYSAAKNKPAPGDAVIFEAHVANRGGVETGGFAFTWWIDGTPAQSSSRPSLAPGETLSLELPWTWQDGTHTIRIVLDPQNLVAEASEQNNTVEDRTDALAVGFWVEQSVYDWFNLHQVELGLGSTSWEDWAQRQLRKWNEMFTAAVSPLTPQGVLDRVRLDKVTILPDGTWPDCSNGPSPEDQTVDLVWGFVAEQVGVHSGHNCGEFNFYTNNPQFQDFEPPLLHEMSHARYLIDLYGLNVYLNAAQLSAGVDGSATALPVDRDVEWDGNFALPVSLAVEGELIVCQSKSAASFTNCTRGAEGTTPRAHASNAWVNLAVVRLQDGLGNLVQGSPALPVVGDWTDHLYYNRYPDDLMSGGQIYGQYSAYSWNRIAGQRPICGNYNSPCNIGVFLNDLPQHNILEVRDTGGVPLPGVRVEVFRARPISLWYGKVFMNPPDQIHFTNALGQADLGPNPFSGSGAVTHGYGLSQTVLLLRLSSNGASLYRFFEITQANEAYWSGQQDRTTYVIPTDLTAGQPPTALHLPLLANRYPPPPPLFELEFENTFNSANGGLGSASGVTFVEGHVGQGAQFDGSDSLTYATGQNIHRSQGCIEFWIKPQWNGSDNNTYSFFEIGDAWFNRMLVTKDGANNFRFIVWSGDAEYGTAHNIQDWQAGEWHHVKVTWQGSTIALYLDGTLVDTNPSAVLPSELEDHFHIGASSWGDHQAQAVLDSFQIHADP